MEILMNGTPPPPPRKHYYLGFNLVIDRQAVLNLVQLAHNAVGLNALSITVCITSPGGDPSQALFAYEILRALPVPLHTHAIGSVQSAACIILLAGEQRRASPGANFLFHETIWTPPAATPIDIDTVLGQAEGIKHHDRWNYRLFAERLGKPEREVSKWFRGQRMRDTDFVLKHGVIHEVRTLAVNPADEFVQVSYKF